MKMIIVKDDLEGAKLGLKIIKESLEKDALKTIGLATGSTPVSLYNLLRESDLDFSNTVSVNLDEYVGLSGDHPQSYRYFMETHLFEAKPFKKSYVPNGIADDLNKECADYEKIIEENPVNLQVLGIGANGHIGFNEPGASFDSVTRVVDLVPETIEANSRFFKSIHEVPKKAISMGIKTILKSDKIVIFAYGTNKASAIKKMLENDITEEVPATILKKHSDVTVIVDEDAATLLNQ